MFSLFYSFFFVFPFVLRASEPSPKTLGALGSAPEGQVAWASVLGLDVLVWPLLAPKHPQASCLVLSPSWSFPSRGQAQESGSQLPAPSRQNHIRASPASLSPSGSAVSSPAKGRGKRGLEKGRKLPLLSLARKNLVSSCHQCGWERLMLGLMGLQKSLK